jgi:multiple sugar transport system ATP-binding protein
VLNHGVLQQVDTPDNVYQRPANQFVATFIGSPRMNFITCRLERNLLVSADSVWHIPLKTGTADRIVGHSSLIMGIRAEDITLSDSAEEGAIAGTVYVAEPLGDRTIVDIHVGQASVKVKAAPTFDTAPGQPLWVRIDTDRLHLFDQATGAAIQ